LEARELNRAVNLLALQKEKVPLEHAHTVAICPAHKSSKEGNGYASCTMLCRLQQPKRVCTFKSAKITKITNESFVSDKS
jgi:hypothetical protein